MMPRISKQQIAANADRARGVKRGMEGLNILLFGWLNFRKYGHKYRHAIHARDFLFITEVMDLSVYAGCDLTKKSLQ